MTLEKIQEQDGRLTDLTLRARNVTQVGTVESIQAGGALCTVAFGIGTSAQAVPGIRVPLIRTSTMHEHTIIGGFTAQEYYMPIKVGDTVAVMFTSGTLRSFKFITHTLSTL